MSKKKEKQLHITQNLKLQFVKFLWYNKALLREITMGTAIVITSGKGGTGKTSMTCGIGSALAKLGKHVLCLDMDVGLRNLDLALGMTDCVLMDFTDVLSGRCTLERAAV